VDHLPAQLVGERAGEQLEGEHAQRVHVAARVDGARVAADLLRAHVGDRAGDLPGKRLARGQIGVLLHGPGHPEVDHLGPGIAGAALLDEDVRRLEVTVDDPVEMAVVDGVADLRDDLDPG
jgi:hypothetical protein